MCGSIFWKQNILVRRLGGGPCRWETQPWHTTPNFLGKRSIQPYILWNVWLCKTTGISDRSWKAQVSSPPARWGLLDFMSVASSSSFSSSFSSSSASSPPPPRPPRRPRRPCSTATRDPQCSLPDLNHDHPRPVFPAGPQPRPSTPSVPCRTSTTTIRAQCSLPDLNWAWMVVVEVRQGTLGADGRGWGPAGNM